MLDGITLARLSRSVDYVAGRLGFLQARANPAEDMLYLCSSRPAFSPGGHFTSVEPLQHGLPPVQVLARCEVGVDVL